MSSRFDICLIFNRFLFLVLQNTEMHTTSKKRKYHVDMVLDSQKEMMSSRRKKNKSESSGIEHEDKLDKLIEQYRSRFSAKAENGKQVSRGVKKWFMT